MRECKQHLQSSDLQESRLQEQGSEIIVWSDLPVDLQARVFGCLPDAKRCKAIPFVCREWRRIHSAYPPVRRELHVTDYISTSLLHYFVSMASSLEILHVDLLKCSGEYDSPGLFGQLLAVAAVKAPGLRRLVLDLENEVSICSLPMRELLDELALLSQLEVLTINGFEIPESGPSLQNQGLAGLWSLKELHLWEVRSDAEDSRLPDAFWQTLADLQGLTKLVFKFEKDGCYHKMAIFQEISLLQNLRDLEANPGFDSWELHQDLTLLHTSFGNLTKLTQLIFNMYRDYMYLSLASLKPIMSLPGLERLHLNIELSSEQPGGNDTDLYLESTCLTMLRVDGDGGSSVLEVLPVSAPAWPHLRELTLQGTGLSAFSEALANAMSRLTFLDLTKNKFARLPTAIKLLSNLQHCQLAQNPLLQLETEDAEVLAGLSCLHTLNVGKSDGCPRSGSKWTDQSVAAFLAISKRLPLLKLTCLSE